MGIEPQIGVRKLCLVQRSEVIADEVHLGTEKTAPCSSLGTPGMVGSEPGGISLADGS